MRTIKTALLLVSFAAVFATSGFAGNRDCTYTLNFPLARLLEPSQTYTGIVADSRRVTYSAAARGLVAGLTLGVANALTGSSLGERPVTVQQYVIRLDSPYGSPATVVTVYQADNGNALIEPGQPVFINAFGCRRSLDFYVQVIAARTPEAYGVAGLEEQRIARLQRRR